LSASGFLSHADDDEVVTRRFGLVTVALLHVAVIFALLQIGEVRQAIVDAGPLFVSFITPEAPVETPPPPVVVPKKQPPPLIVSQRASTVPVEFVAPVAPPEPVAEPAPVDVPPTPPAPVAVAAPKLITHVEYVRRPAPEYPTMSRRFGEQGRVVVRVLINARGQAERVELQEPSPYRRLNDAALNAAQEAQYRPYTENGVAQPVWALVPLSFELGH